MGWKQNHRRSGGRESPAGSRDGAPVGGLGDEVPQKLKNFKSSYKQILRIFLVVFHTFSPIYAYDFSVLVGIIPLSLRNGGAFDTVCPSCLQVGGARAP